MIGKIMDSVRGAFSGEARDAQLTGEATDANRAFSNPNLGYGDANDTIANTTITSRRLSEQQIEVLYINSWSAAKVVDLIVDDVFSPGLNWANEEDEATARLQESIEDMDVMSKVAGAVKSARLYGSSIVILAPKSGDFMEPLDVENIKEGDISHLIVVPKPQLEIWQVHLDPRLPEYGEVYSYRWSLMTDGKVPIPGQSRNHISQMTVHASRCLRFDGIKPNTDVGWVYANLHEDRRWGISILYRVYDDIINDMIASAGGTEMVKRSSVPVIRMKNFRDVMARGPVGDNISPEAYGSQISSNINNNKVMFMDLNDVLDKLEVSGSGVNDVIESQTNRLAMIAGVPISRFKGESATGLSATGDGDARDWRISVEGYRKNAIDEQWDFLMMALARNAGLAEVPDWEWGMLGEMDAAEQATISKTLSETVKLLVSEGIIDESEARAIMNTSEIVDLDEDWVPEIEPEMDPVENIPPNPLTQM